MVTVIIVPANSLQFNVYVEGKRKGTGSNQDIISDVQIRQIKRKK